MLQVSRVAKSFGGRTLFRDVTWTVNGGDRIGLVGPNGAGKTTLLKIIAGAEPRDSGAIILGKNVTLGYLPQEVARTTHGTSSAGAEGTYSAASPQAGRVRRGSVLEHVLGGRPDIMAARTRLAELEGKTATADTVHEQVEIIEELTRLGSHQLEPQAHKILKGLGFEPQQLTASMAQLSGGWAMRAELAKLLLAAPKVLLLDEPTNHLDLASLGWLEAFLADYEGAWVVVSHDRYFLNRRVTSIAELTPEGILVFDGTYDDYVEGRAELDEQLEAKAVLREKRMDEMRAFVERFRAKASKARQAQSKAKALDKLSAEANSAQRAKKPHRSLKIALPQPARSGDIVATTRDIKKAYGEKVVYDGVSLTVRRGDRIALVGENGAGKSTLLKILSGALEADTGSRELGHNVATYYFAQHQMDALARGRTVYDEMRGVMPDASESQVRGILGAFLFSGDDVEKRIDVLSGGEKSRLVLAMMLAKPANFLLLDEPTNHLDLTSRGVLENVLGDFAGTIVFISHDRYFIDRVANKLVEVHPGPGKGSVLSEFPGDYDYYLWKRAEVAHEALGAQGAARDTAETEPAPGRVTREERKAQAREANKKAKELTKLEGEIGTAEARVKEIDALLCDPAVYADAAKSKSLLDERRTLDERLPELYAAWESAAG